MCIEVVTVVESGYIRVTASGDYSFDGLMEFIDQVKIEANKAGRKKILIDSQNINGDMSDADKFFAGRRIAETFGSRLKAAVLMPENKITKLGESAAVSRGASFLVTSSEQEGLDWLLAS